MEIIIAIVMSSFFTYGVTHGSLEQIVSSDLKKAVVSEREIIIENASYECRETNRLYGVKK